MDTESSNGKEGMVTLLDIVIIKALFLQCMSHFNCDYSSIVFASHVMLAFHSLATNHDVFVSRFSL